MPKGKVKKWSLTEDEILKQNSENMTISELSEIIDATWMQIYYRCKRLKITPKSVHKGWTIQELQIACSAPRKVAIELLGRSKDSINSRKQYAKKQSQCQYLK